jgi:MFS family permease
VRDFAVILTVVFLFFAAQTAVQVVVPIAASTAQLSGTVIGLLLAIPAAVGLLLDLPLSALSDAIGRRLPIAVGALFGCAAAIVLALGTESTGYFSGMVLWAIAASLIQFPALAFITEAAPGDQHARIQGYNGSVQRLALLIATISVGLFLERDHGTTLAFGAAGVALAAIAILIFPLNEGPANREPVGFRRIGGSYRTAVELLTRRPAMLLSALIALANGTVIITIGNSFVPLYLVRDLHQAPFVVGLLLAWRNLIAAVLSAQFGAIVPRVGLLRLVLTTNALAAASVLFVPLVSETPLLFVVVALQGIGFAFTAGTGNVLIAGATAPSERALAFAANQLVARIGTLLLPLLLGSLMDVDGARAVFYVGGALAVANVAWMGLVASKVRGRQLDSAVAD